MKFFVDGVPIPQGSMSAFIRGARAVVIDQKSPRLKPWRQMVNVKARDYFPAPLEGAVEASLEFFLPHPRYHYTKTGAKSSRYRIYPPVKPDLDKLVRAVLDGLTGVAFRDDAQVVTIQASKTYGIRPGVQISIRSIKE